MNLKNRLDYRLQKIWYGKKKPLAALRPFSWLFLSLVHFRRLLYRWHILQSKKLDVPVIVVGNISVGGTGKTPLVVWIANYLKTAGYKPGIISRGYGGCARKWPQQVRPDADPVMVGDEAVVIARQTNCPMAVGPSRVNDAHALLKYADIDIIISDDGLQHYALQRNVEIAVIDGLRRFGNGYCLPAGPLREPVSRINEVDLRVANGVAAEGEYGMKYIATEAINLVTGEKKSLEEFRGQSVLAIAGIGNPDSFFNFLRAGGIRLDAQAFPDHYIYKSEDLELESDKLIMMTEKDAVKCKRLANENCWYIPVSVEISEEFGTQLISLLEKSNG